MRILVAGSSSKLPQLSKFRDALIRHGEECEIVNDRVVPSNVGSEFSDMLHGINKFNQLINSFKPEIIYIDRGSRFGVKAVRCHIPVFLQLRGDYWSELEWARKTQYSGMLRRCVLYVKNNWWTECFRKSTAIMPICKYLDGITKKHYPKKNTSVLYQGVDPEEWTTYSKTNLKHPCVGLVQDATILGKTMELLTLTKVMESMPDVTFYWAGSGYYLNYVLPKLEKYSNFRYLGRLEYPNQVRDFLGTADICGLMSGIDMSPLSLLEAQIMGRPVIATNVGGVSENMVDKKTGFLVNRKNPDDWIDRIMFMLENPSSSAAMGNNGRKFVSENFSWDKIAEKFVKTAHCFCG